MQNHQGPSAVGRQLFVLIAFSLGMTASLQSQSIPVDVKPTCTVTSSQFDSWYASGHPSVNGVVNPANSVTFSHNSNCAFYQWSKQMFLWLTSPAPSEYGGGDLVLNSRVFFDVTPPDDNGNRHLVPHGPDFVPTLAIRDQKTGPENLPVVVTKSGQLRPFREAAPGERPLIRGAGGAKVEVGSASRVNGELRVLDKAGKPLAVPAPLKAEAAVAHVALTRFVVNGVPIFIDPSGNLVDTEEGQATGNVLLAQNGSLVYYTISVNDVFAYFLTWAKDNHFQPAPPFPTTQAQLNQVIIFAKQYGVTFPDPEALAIEVKSAWVEATSLPDPQNYVRMTARVPVFNKSNPAKWTATGQYQTTQLALVGMHVVGSAAGHPEMIWSTFEHFGNTPNGAYQYINGANKVVAVPQNTSGAWLFTQSGAAGPFNVSHAKIDGSDIVAPTGQTISPSNTLRIMAWGASSNASPNPEDATPAASNTELLSIQNSVSSLTPTADVRNRYFMPGSTWTLNGLAPTTSYGNPGNTGGNGIGTSLIGNSTMETYFQPANTSFTTQLGNCLVCHQIYPYPQNKQPTADVSHIYEKTQPLPPPTAGAQH
jgi:hypothetical protein